MLHLALDGSGFVVRVTAEIDDFAQDGLLVDDLGEGTRDGRSGCLGIRVRDVNDVRRVSRSVREVNSRVTHHQEKRHLTRLAAFSRLFETGIPGSCQA